MYELKVLEEMLCVLIVLGYKRKCSLRNIKEVVLINC